MMGYFEWAMGLQLSTTLEHYTDFAEFLVFQMRRLFGGSAFLRVALFKKS